MIKNEDISKRVIFLLGRLTVMRRICNQKTVTSLTDLCVALSEENAPEAMYHYHAMTSALLEIGSRRVSGNIWKDFLFEQLLEEPNIFSSMSASNRVDPPVIDAMKRDLSLMQELFLLDANDFVNEIEKVAGEKNKGKNDKIKKKNDQRKSEERVTKLALAAWSVNSTASLDSQNQLDTVRNPIHGELPEDLELDGWINWSYDSPGDRIEYISDEALALVYRKLLGEDNWGDLVDALGEFHAHYGNGDFLRYRVFLSSNRGLVGSREHEVLEWDEVLGLDKQKERLYANVLRFLHTDIRENVLLYGEVGMGKTTLLLSLMEELPDVSVVFLLDKSEECIARTIDILKKQPFKFILMIDDFDMAENEYRSIKSSMHTIKEAKNVLLAAASAQNAPDKAIFSTQIHFEMPSFSEFVQIVQEYIYSKGFDIDKSMIRFACENYKKRSDDFSIKEAISLANGLIRSNERKN